MYEQHSFFLHSPQGTQDVVRARTTFVRSEATAGADRVVREQLSLRNEPLRRGPKRCSCANNVSFSVQQVTALKMLFV
ncbi:MAG TPA: hypothetical protein VFK05_12805, partial [Polyangiaceae bacterium]|nr:hypothetical protein [Polyangiaceae bacterium]